MSSTPPPTIASTANAKKLSSSSSSKKSTKKISRQRPKIASSCQSKPKKACKSSKHNKFAKLNEEFISKSYLSKSCVIASSLSNFSLANAGSQPNAKKLKCLLVGDARVGKSALMFLFLKQIFQFEYQPTIVDDYEVKIVLNGESYTLSLFDTAGQEDWETLRVMAYPDTDVILLCYSVVRPDSMENIKTKWMPELNKYLPDALIVLVGTQVDLRDSNVSSSSSSQANADPRARHITTREGEELKQRINAYKYIECSALSQLNIKEVFDSCIEAYAKSNPPVQPSCFETLFRRFTKTIRSHFNIRLHSSSSSSPSNAERKSNAKQAKYSNKEGIKYLHEQ